MKKTQPVSAHFHFFNWQWPTGWPTILQSLVASLIIAIIAFLIAQAGRRIISRAVKRSLQLRQANELRIRTLESLLGSVLSYTLLFIAAVAILGEFGVNTSAIVASAGVVGLAIGFGAQGLVSDIVTGFFVLLEGQVNVGEYVTIGTYSGIVERTGLRVMQIRGGNGDLYFLPNRQISALSNHSRGNMQALVDITVPNDMNIDDALQTIRTACEQAKPQLPELIEGPNVVGIEALAAANLTVRVIARTKNGEQTHVERVLRQAIKRALDAANDAKG